MKGQVYLVAKQHLGLPLFIGRSKKYTLVKIKERVWKKVQGCKEKLLFKVGREVLMKVVC